MNNYEREKEIHIGVLRTLNHGTMIKCICFCKGNKVSVYFALFLVVADEGMWWWQRWRNRTTVYYC